MILASCCGRNRSWSGSSSGLRGRPTRVLRSFVPKTAWVDDACDRREMKISFCTVSSSTSISFCVCPCIDATSAPVPVVGRRRCRRRAASRPGARPLLAVGHQGLQRVAALLHHGALSRFVEQQAGGLQHGREHARASLGKLLGEHLPGPACDVWRRFGLYHHPAASLPFRFPTVVSAIDAIYTRRPHSVIRVDLILRAAGARGLRASRQPHRDGRGTNTDE